MHALVENRALLERRAAQQRFALDYVRKIYLQRRRRANGATDDRSAARGERP